MKEEPRRVHSILKAESILNILSEITHNNTEESIYESAIVERSGLPSKTSEVGVRGTKRL